MVSHRGPGGGSFVAGGESGNVYAGHDGNVYRRDESGAWHKYDNGQWSSAGHATPRGSTAQPADAVGHLARDSAARAEGAARIRHYGSYRSGGEGAGSYRASAAARGRRR